MAKSLKKLFNTHIGTCIPNVTISTCFIDSCYLEVTVLVNEDFKYEEDLIFALKKFERQKNQCLVPTTFCLFIKVGSMWQWLLSLALGQSF